MTLNELEYLFFTVLMNDSVQGRCISAVKIGILREADDQGHQFGSVAPHGRFLQFELGRDVTVGGQNAHQHVQVSVEGQYIDEGQSSGCAEHQTVQRLDAFAGFGRVLPVQHHLHSPLIALINLNKL